MKYIVPFILITLFCASCEKDKSLPGNLRGKWNWFSLTGGYAGETYTPESTGYKETVEFTKDSHYRLYRNDSLIIDCHFNIKKTHSIISTEPAMIIFYNDLPIRQSYTITGDTLVLCDECVDCYTNYYKRNI